MRHLLFALLYLSHPLAAQNPNCRPVIVARCGLAAPLLPLNTDADPETDVVGVQVKATDFVRSCTSPCGATEFKYRIRKAGVGTGVPTDTTEVFTCQDLGVQELELWAIDPQGNAAYALTYIIAQDNLGQCDLPVQPLLPSCSPDAIRPTLLVHNGLAINIVPSATGGTARALASDFVLSRADNCEGPIRLRIRRVGQGTGVPTATSLHFTCADLGAQEVEIWAGDSKGNWTFAITYVIVQDNGLLESDCKVLAPSCSPDLTPATLEVLNGLSVPIGANGRVKMPVVDWLRRRTDNCGPSVALRIRREGEGAGAPTGTTVEFTCIDLGVQEVEIWSRDLAGNWSFTRSYVIVQDNLGSCGQMKSSRSDEASMLTKTAGPLRLSPNPAADAFTLESSGEPFSRIDLTDMMGRTVRSIELGQPVQHHSVWVGDLPAGVYVVRAGGQAVQVVVM